MQIPAKSIIDAILASLANRRSSFFCRKSHLIASKFSLMNFFKNTFYSALAILQEDSIYSGFFGMGCYMHNELLALHDNQGNAFRPFQLRLLLPTLIYQPNLFFFDERSRLAGHSSFGFTKYMSEAFSLLARSDLIYRKGLKILIKLSVFTILICIFCIVAVKILIPASILPGFATIILVNLVSTLIVLVAIYILSLKQERASSSVYGSATVSLKKIVF